MDTTQIFVTGYAKLPHGITAKELYSVIAVGLVVERHTGVIIDSDCSLATDLAKNFVKRILVGTNLNDMDAIEKRIKTYYFGSAKKAITSAVKTCGEKYRQIMENGDLVNED
ncbi:DUF3870 domain-containing protein [Fusibacter sp. JL298sf-3]